jgi:integrase
LNGFWSLNYSVIRATINGAIKSAGEPFSSLRATRGGGYVFINPDTAMPFTDIKNAFVTACRLAGIHNLHWHDLHHTFGTRLAEAGFSKATIADLMGHSDPQTTRRYTHPTDRAKRERRWRLGECQASGSATILPNNNGHR